MIRTPTKTGFRIRITIDPDIAEKAEALMEYEHLPLKFVIQRAVRLAGCPKDGIILDPFMGAGTTALVAIKNYRHYIGFELNPDYVKLAEKRVSKVQLKFA